MARTPKTFITGKLKSSLLKAIDRILKEPLRLDMSIFVSGTRQEFEDLDLPKCGTVGCIAGWAHLSSFSVKQLARMNEREHASLDVNARRWFERELAQQPAIKAKFEEDDFETFATIQYLVGRITDTIYSVEGWPRPYRARYEKAKTPRGRARATAIRIHHFIMTGK